MLPAMQLALLYTEAILIAQYVYQVPTRLQCAFVTGHVKRDVEFIGLHGSGPRGIPIFCVYLAILMHTYRIGRQQVWNFFLTYIADTCDNVSLCDNM